MAKANIQSKAFTDNDAAREAIEALMWPNGPVCPHCGCMGKIGRIEGKSARPGLYYCGDCKKQFTVTIGTIFERSKIPLTKWLAALFLMVSSKKGISAHQIHRMLGITYKSAWFMMHRLREAMRSDDLTPFGGEGKTVEVDETYIGRVKGIPKRHGSAQHKNMVLTLVERGGAARSFHVDGKAISDIMPIVRENVARESAIHTDEAKHYYDVSKEYAEHETVNHKREEYARYDGERLITSNTVEGYFSIFKRGMKGVYQHCGEQHLHRYLAEFDFRYSNRVALGCNDATRAERLATGIVGKRLTYRRIDEA